MFLFIGYQIKDSEIYTEKLVAKNSISIDPVHRVIFNKIFPAVGKPEPSEKYDVVLTDNFVYVGKEIIIKYETKINLLSEEEIRSLFDFNITEIKNKLFGTFLLK